MPASSSAGIVRFLKEVTPGVVESGGPQIYRTTGGTLSQSTESSEDNELRADRGRGDSTLVSGSVAGNLDVNWSHKTHDDFLESLLASAYVESGADGVTTVADMTFNQVGGLIEGTSLPDLALGQWFRIDGAGTAANDGVYKCSDSVEPTTSSITVDTAVKDVVTDAVSASTDVIASRLTQSNTDPDTYTIERELSDVTQFFSWAGCYVNSLSLNYSITDKLAGSFGFIAQESEVQDTVTLFPGIGAEVAATTTPFFNSVTGTSVLLDGASMGASCVESMSIDIQANLRERKCIGGGLSASSVATDPFTISFTANIYFGSSESAALYAKKLTDTVLTFAVAVTDSDGVGLAITFPRAKITSAEVDGGGMGSDVMMSLSATASTDPTTSTQIIFDRLGSMA